MQGDLERFLHTTLESPSLVQDLSWPDGDRPLVLKIRDRAGTLWIAKRHWLAESYHAELTAYLRWTEHLQGRAPRLHAADGHLRTLLLTALPGVPPGDWAEPELLRQAGEILRALHEAEHFPPYDSLIADKLAQLEEAAARGRALIEPSTLHFARRALEGLSGIPPPPRVPCHLDYSPRNWLVDQGRLYVIDFGDAKPDAWINDFGRLFIGWGLESAARHALLEGYGASPGAEDLRILRASYTTTLVSHVVLAHEHGYTKHEAACRTLLEELLASADP